MSDCVRAHDRAGTSVSRNTLLVAAVALAVAGAGDAAAKPRTKKLDDVSAPAAIQQRAGGPVRFFTINEVLAKRDGRASPDQPTRLAAVDPKDTQSDASAPLRAKPMGTEPFGLFTFRAPEGMLWVKWRGVESDMAAEAKVIAACRSEPDECASPAARRFLAIVREARDHTGQARIGTINRAVNAAIRYVSDMAQHGMADKWTSPLKTLAAGQGDCEDYAIAKYAALREAGTSVDDLRLVLVRDRLAGDHAVLAVRHAGRWLVLDNRHLIMADAGELTQFTPLFAIDHQGVKLFAAPYAQRPVHESEGDVALALPAAETSGPEASALPTLSAAPFLI
jgi:predicted transglutaminase-like cysteine proteinase